MKLIGIFAAAVMSWSLQGSTIVDVTGVTSVTVRAGNTLSFEVLSGNFAANAAAFSLASKPSELSFALVSLPLTGGPGSFSASLGSPDGAAATQSGAPLTFQSGWFSGSGYSGAVSTLQGSFQLSARLAEQIFESGAAILSLRNDGPTVTLDLSPYLLRQDLFVTLSGGPLTVGGIVDAVHLDSPGASSFSLAVIQPAALSPVPEPASSLLLLGGGALLCVVSGVLGRVTKAKRGSVE